MSIQRLRSVRDPAFWLPWLVVAAIMPVLAWVAHESTAGYVAKLRVLCQLDPAAKVAHVALGLKVLGVGACSFALGTAALMFRYFTLVKRHGRLPPPGLWSLGARVVITGAQAERLARFGRALCVALALTGLALVAAVWNAVVQLPPAQPPIP